MRGAGLALALLVAAGATGAVAKDKPASLLSASDLDPALVLAAPPAPGRPQARAELAELHAMQTDRTAAERAAAKADGEIKDATFYAAAIGPSFDLARLPETTRLIMLVQAAEKDAADRGKDEFRRPRPWIVDPNITPCERGNEPLSSYPSGHATRAFAIAGVLSRLVPAKAAPVLARAARYGETRIICEQHFRSDVTAGEALGLLVAERLMTKPAFRTQFDAAKRELIAAGVSR